MRTKVAVGTFTIAGMANSGRQVEYDGDRDGVVAVGKIEQGFAGAFLDIGGVDDGQFAATQADCGDVMEGVEGVGVRVENGFVVSDEAAEVVRGEDFSGEEVAGGEGGFAAARGADQGDEGEIR